MVAFLRAALEHMRYSVSPPVLNGVKPTYWGIFTRVISKQVVRQADGSLSRRVIYITREEVNRLEELNIKKSFNPEAPHTVDFKLPRDWRERGGEL